MKEDKTQAGQTVPLDSLVGNQYEQMSWDERYRHHEALAIECIETAKAKVEEGNFGIAQCYLDCVPKHIESMTGCIQVSNTNITGIDCPCCGKPFDQTVCNCGYEHSCGGPAEACCMPGCSECGAKPNVRLTCTERQDGK